MAIKQVPKTKVKRWGRVQQRMVPIEFELLDKVSDGHKGKNNIQKNLNCIFVQAVFKPLDLTRLYL